MTDINLAHADAAELTELLQFIDTWLAGDPEPSTHPCTRHLGTPGYDTSHIRNTLTRYIFLLRGDTDGDLFQPNP